jgi:DNA helicase MCM9
MVRVRVDFHRISCPGISPAVAQVRMRHTGRLLSLSGTVMRASAIKSHEVEHLMECTSCKHRFLVAASKEDGKNADLPSACPSSRAQGAAPPGKQCNNATFRAVSAGRPIVCDYQELRVQEPMGRTRTGVGAIWTVASLWRGGSDKFQSAAADEGKNGESGKP